MGSVDFLGYAASVTVLVTFCMNAMIPLRTIALASNVLFAAYGYWGHATPVLILHAVLFPLNAGKLVRLCQGTRNVGSTRCTQALGDRIKTVLSSHMTVVAGATCAIASIAMILPPAIVALSASSQTAEAQICRTLAGDAYYCASPALRHSHLDYIPGCSGPQTKGKALRFGDNVFVCSGRQR